MTLPRLTPQEQAQDWQEYLQEVGFDPKAVERRDRQWAWWFYGPGTVDEP
jgi:hypothetical protein